MRRPEGTHPVYWRTLRYSPPKDWNLTSVDDIAAVTKGKLPKTLFDEPTDTSVPYLLIDGLSEGEHQYTEDTELPMVQESDSVVVADGSRSGLPLRGISGALGSTLLRYRAKDGYDANFLYYLLQSLYSFTNTATIGGAVPHLDKRLLGQLKLAIPEEDEAEKIAEILVAFDELKKECLGKLTTAHRLKSALMQQLFTKGIPGRHEEFQIIHVFRKAIEIPKCWDADRLGSNSVRFQYGTNGASNDYKTGYPVIAIPQVVAPRLELGDVPYVDIPVDEANNLKLEEDDVLLIRTNGNSEYIGKSTLVTQEVAVQHVVFASYLIRVRTDKEKLLGSYLNYFLASPLGRRQSLSMANTSAGNYNIGARSLRQFTIPNPDIDEQEETVKILHACEDNIDANVEKLNSLANLKKSLLQNLLTGKVRLKKEATV